MKYDVEKAAALCHEVNRAYCRSLGDDSQPDWAAAPQWQKDSALEGVRNRLNNPHAHPRASHESWLEQKRKDGWSYGAVKDPAKKEHPCFVPYEELPSEQRAKDWLFCSVVETLRECGLIEQGGA